MATIINMYVLKVVCCYCGKDLGRRRCTPAMNGSVSHGICKPCNQKLRERLGLAPESKTLLDELNGA